jgi:putative protein kinase ArgK-like GTPase of G3E family
LGLLLQIPEHRKASSTRHPERHPPPKSTTKPIITIAAAKAQGLKKLLAAAESITRPLVQNTQKKTHYPHQQHKKIAIAATNVQELKQLLTPAQKGAAIADKRALCAQLDAGNIPLSFD